MQGRSPCPRSAERGIFFMLIKDQEGGLRGKPYQGVSPFSLRLCVCADTLGGGRWPVLPFDPISLVLAQRNGVEPPKKSAFLPRWLHRPRERCKSVDYTFLARLVAGAGAVFLAHRAFESFARLFKGGGVQGRRPCPRSAERGILLYACFHEIRKGVQGGNPIKGFPPFLLVCACVPILWEVVVSLSCDSTPFLWCLPKETVSSRQRKALFTLVSPPAA